MAYKSKNYSKFVATAATATLVASAFAPFASAATDVPASSPYASAVDFLATKGINGFSDGTFKPQLNITRTDAAMMLVNVLGLDIESAPASGFTDVPARAVKHVNALKAAGITQGAGGGKFNAQANITRGELAVWIQKGFELTSESTTVAFKDVSGQYTKAVAALVENKVTFGKSATTFGTSANATRGEFAMFLQRANDAVSSTDLELAIVNAEAAIDTLANIDLTLKNKKFVLDARKAVNEALALDKTAKIGNLAALEKAEATIAKLEAIEAAQVAIAALPTVEKLALADSTKVAEARALVAKAEALGGTVAAESVAVLVALEKQVKVLEENSKELAVVGVSAINATQVEVKFNKAVNKASLFVDGESGAFKANTVSLTSLDTVVPGAISGKLSADGKTLTVTAENVLSKRYDVVVDKLTDADLKQIVKYEEMITIAADKTAPTITGIEQISANNVKINFSEPVKAYTTATLKYTDGTNVTGASVNVAAGATSVTVDLSNVAVEINKPITITFIGLQDQAGNLLTPNPATVTVTKQQVDGVKPTVSTVTQTGAKTFNVKFSKDLAATPTVTVSGYTVDTITKVSASEYKVTVRATDANLTGVQNVTVTAGYTDLAGQAGEAVTKVVTFIAETAAPKATSVKTVTVDGVEYLELTFDKDVTEGNITVSGSYTKNYVTASVANATVAATYASTSSKKVVRTPLSGIAALEGADYTVDVVSSTVNSLSGVAFEKTSATFTRGKDVATNTTKLGAPVVTQTTNDTVTVTFTGEVDGASATNATNYKVDGAVVEKAELEAYGATTSGKQVVTLTLKKDSNAFTGTRNITVQNVKALGSSVTMDKYTENTVSLKENVRPTVTNAVLTANDKITLTFSEAVSNVDNTAGVDFELYIGGTKSSTLALTAETVAALSEKNTLVLTITGGAISATDLASGLTVKPATTVNVVDAVNNTLNFTSLNVAR